MHSELPSPRNVNWKKSQSPSSRLASYVMNNYWHTNYKADQEGVSTYHYSIIPHGLFNQANAMRAGIERSQPLIVRQTGKDDPKPNSLFEVSPKSVIASYVKPASTGNGYLVRLFNAGGSPEVATFTISGKPKSVYLSNPWEERGKLVEAIALPANGIATVRVE